MKIAVIPARGGSKRIPRKNIKSFCGKPIIAWPINVALLSKIFDRVIVSTDDYEIAQIAEKFGAEVPFIRPSSLSDDFTGTIDVVKHAIETLSEVGDLITDVCCIYPTAPLIQICDLEDSYAILKTGVWDYCFSAYEISPTLLRSFKILKNGAVDMVFPNFYDSRSQDLPKLYNDAGQFYWGTKSAWLNKQQFFSAKSKAIVLTSSRVQDIDTEADWVRCERLFKNINGID